jgi:hypothetical protein
MKVRKWEKASVGIVVENYVGTQISTMMRYMVRARELLLSLRV